MGNYSFLAEESFILLFALELGLEIGLAYDLLRIIRRVWKCNWILTSTMDLIFWLFVGWRTFMIMHTHSNGTLRWFAIMGVMVTLLSYMKFVSRHIVMAGVFMLKPVRIFGQHCKKVLTKNLKLSKIKLTKKRKGMQDGKKCSISDEIS